MFGLVGSVSYYSGCSSLMDTSAGTFTGERTGFAIKA